ncbi:protein lin-37 homolog [Drosophila ficusphila]|uniref:protein lin-37 homolog n=1 Tax=Drosophila ficusphila TaxID=30025 RepID=UPI0007E746D1|nr:protein lin-37 homolog [Drosophila ficusphila]
MWYFLFLKWWQRSVEKLAHVSVLKSAEIPFDLQFGIRNCCFLIFHKNKSAPKMKTTPKKKETSLRLREARREEQKPETSQQTPDDDADSDLPIRGRPSKKLLLQKQQQRQYQGKSEPEGKTVPAVVYSKASTSSAALIGGRIKGRRVLYKKTGGGGGSAQKTPGESYVMRLFERSLDLSKYQDGTPLYPICRAWMANQPRNPAVATFQTDGSVTPVKREDNGEEILSRLRSGELKVLTQLPQAKSTDLPIIPPRLEFGQDEKEREKALEGASASDLLASNVARWKKVRGHWLKHTQKYDQERYEVIDAIMNVVCKN